MTKVNSLRGGCVDVFHASILQNAKYEGKYEIPVLREEHTVPQRLITFSKAMTERKDFHQWVCFYEDDFMFERIWNNPSRYVLQLSKFDGVISPDFSVYYDMPYAMQVWNIFRGRAIGAWLQEQGIKVIPNIRFGDERTFDCCCAGVPKHSVISIGTLGCVKVKTYRETFEQGIAYTVKRLRPETVVIYGTVPKTILQYEKYGVHMKAIEPLSYHKEVKR